MMTPHVEDAVRAAQDRKAVELSILSMNNVCSFTDFFVICSGTSTRHTQAISDGILEKLKASGLSPTHVEGYSQGEWILLDYLNFVVHIFTDRSRHFYDLERLWKTAARVPVPEDGR
jgi:ribosome-associated protein